jgi:hypothetical protein
MIANELTGMLVLTEMVLPSDAVEGAEPIAGRLA